MILQCKRSEYFQTYFLIINILHLNKRKCILTNFILFVLPFEISGVSVRLKFSSRLPIRAVRTGLRPSSSILILPAYVNSHTRSAELPSDGDSGIVMIGFSVINIGLLTCVIYLIQWSLCIVDKGDVKTPSL